MKAVTKMARVKLSQGAFALVDDDDLELLGPRSWSLSTEGYAVAKINGKQKRMHRIIMQAKDSEVVDHINGDKLDNRRANLRLCSHAENRRNGRTRRDSSSGYKGVRFEPRTGKWQAYISHDGKYRNLGCYSTKEHAAMAYNEEAIKQYGIYAKLNEVML